MGNDVAMGSRRYSCDRLISFTMRQGTVPAEVATVKSCCRICKSRQGHDSSTLIGWSLQYGDDVLGAR